MQISNSDIWLGHMWMSNRASWCIFVHNVYLVSDELWKQKVDVWCGLLVVFQRLQCDGEL